MANRTGENNSFYGRHHTEVTRKRISESMKGEKHRLYGKHLPENTKRKMSETHKGEKNSFYGKTHSEEWKRKRRGENHYNWKGGKSIQVYSVDWTETLKHKKKDE